MGLCTKIWEEPNIYLYILYTQMTESFLKMTENDRDRKWPLSKHQKTIPKAAFAIRCKNHKYLYPYISTTYTLFFNILREKACFLLRFFVSLHRQSKEQSSCAKSRSSMKTEAGLNRWQAPVINEDHKNGQETAFWGIVIQGTLKRRQSMINKTKLLRGWRYFNIKITCT